MQCNINNYSIVSSNELINLKYLWFIIFNLHNHLEKFNRFSLI